MVFLSNQVLKVGGDKMHACVNVYVCAGHKIL